jgi:hypothetical protein
MSDPIYKRKLTCLADCKTPNDALDFLVQENLAGRAPESLWQAVVAAIQRSWGISSALPPLNGRAAAA